MKRRIIVRMIIAFILSVAFVVNGSIIQCSNMVYAEGDEELNDSFMNYTEINTYYEDCHETVYTELVYSDYMLLEDSNKLSTDLAKASAVFPGAAYNLS